MCICIRVCVCVCVTCAQFDSQHLVASTEDHNDEDCVCVSVMFYGIAGAALGPNEDNIHY